MSFTMRARARARHRRKQRRSGFGNKLAGLLGESAEGLGELTVFTGIAIFCVIFGFLVLVFRKKLEVLTHNAEDNERILE